MKNSLEGKIALVTGGSRGLGRYICIALAQQGATVAVNYAHNLKDAEQTVSMIQDFGGKAAAFQADITNEDEVAGVVTKISNQFGSTIDILVNNATGPQPMLAIEESTWDIYLEQLNFFVKAPLLLIKAILPEMKEKRTGSIINIGSEVVQLGNANFSSYVTAKSAMVGMTRSWANELGAYGIRVNLVAPGFIPVERHANINQAGIDQYVSGVPLARIGEPMDIGNSVSFLASDASSFITGQCFSVNGGKTLGI